MEKIEVYYLIDDYTPDNGSTIYGMYSTYEKAEKALEILSDPNHPDNDYGRNMNEDNTIDIRSETLQ